jgi:hypothetical protein
MVVASAASAQNLLTNPGFESGLTGWNFWGNTYAESTNPPAGFVAYEGTGLVSFFGTWSGPYNVSGFFQEFATSEGEAWTMSAKSRHSGLDPMIGSQATGGNWVVMKLAWFDGGGEIGGVESIILDGSYATDTWFDNPSITGFAPAGTVKVQALLLYIQVDADGGAAHIDMVEVYQSGTIPVEETTWGQVKSLFK